MNDLLSMEFRGLRKIISGGQDGVDRGALEAARDFGVQTGGMAPAGFRTIRGPDLSLKELFGLDEHRSRAYQPRTEQNVVDADGTLIIASSLSSPGTALTLTYIAKHSKPHFVIGLKSDNVKAKTQEAVEWIKREAIEVLNVAGNHLNPEFHHSSAYEIVREILFLLQVQDQIQC